MEFEDCDDLLLIKDGKSHKEEAQYENTLGMADLKKREVMM